MLHMRAICGCDVWWVCTHTCGLEHTLENFSALVICSPLVDEILWRPRQSALHVWEATEDGAA
jgi:hypothetical protein